MDYGMPTLIELPTTVECAQMCRALDLQFVELNMNLPQYQPDRMNTDELRRIADEYGIYFTIHLDENLNVCDFNPYVSSAYRKTVIETIGIARSLNVPVLNMHMAKGVYFTLPDKKVFLFDEYRDIYLKRIKDFRDDCENAIGGGDIRICVENSDGYSDFQIEAIDILLESEVFALTFDIGHNYGIGEADEPIIIQRKDRLKHFHFHDGLGRKNHLALGDGEINLQKYYALAKENECRIVLETKTKDGLSSSVSWLRKNLENECSTGC